MRCDALLTERHTALQHAAVSEIFIRNLLQLSLHPPPELRGSVPGACNVAHFPPLYLSERKERLLPRRANGAPLRRATSALKAAPRRALIFRGSSEEKTNGKGGDRGPGPPQEEFFLEAPRFGPDPRSELKAVVSTADHGSVLLALCVAARAQAARSSLRDQSAPPPGPYSHILLLGHGYISSQAWLYYVCLRCSPASSRLGRRREDQSQDKEEKGRERLANHNHFPSFTASSSFLLFFSERGANFKKEDKQKRQIPTGSGERK
ncbi:hypothetical protein SRHO_G00087080 [Serrasalmus rhombeus]